MKNKFYEISTDEMKVTPQQYDFVVDGILKFRRFTIDDIHKDVNKNFRKPFKVDRSKIVDCLRILLKRKLIYYDLELQLMKLNENTTTKIK